MSETTYLKELVVVEDGIAYKFKGVSLSNSNASTILDNLISDYTEQYNNLNTQVTALENQLELGQVKFVTNMTTLNTEQLVNTLYVNDEVVGIVDDGSGIIPQVYLKDGSSVSLKEVERKEEDADDGNEYLGYVNKWEGPNTDSWVKVGGQIDLAGTYGYGFVSESGKDEVDSSIMGSSSLEEKGLLCLKTGPNPGVTVAYISKINSFSVTADTNTVIIKRVNSDVSFTLTKNTYFDSDNSYQFHTDLTTKQYLFTQDDVDKYIDIQIEVV